MLSVVVKHLPFNNSQNKTKQNCSMPNSLLRTSRNIILFRPHKCLGREVSLSPSYGQDLSHKKCGAQAPPGGEWGVGIHSQLCFSPKPTFLLGSEHLFGPGRDSGLQIRVGFSWPNPLWYIYFNCPCLPNMYRNEMCSVTGMR